MRKLIISLSLMLVFILILGGCAAQQGKIENNANSNSNEKQAANKNEAANLNKETSEENNKLNVSEDDLNKLKADIEKNSYEDLKSL
ncbi:MAG: hypothetical protein WC460_05565 [Patescibacteria group bacterium]